MNANVLLRHFMYLDAEMLRSFTAQLLGGVPESSQTEKEHSAGAGGSAEAGLFSFLKASGEADYRYRRSSTETMSLHHQVYSRFEDALDERKALTHLDGSFDFAKGWTVDLFRDGEFVKVRGAVQVTDYSKTLTGVEGFPKLQKALTAVQTINIKNKADSGEITADEATAQRRQLAESESRIKQLPIDGMVALGRNLYVDGEVRVKAQPSGSPLGHVLAGRGNSEALLVSLGAEGMVQSPPTAEWVAVGQVTAGTVESTVVPLATGNVLEDALENMSISLRAIVKVGNAAKFPAFEFMPLAVYREIATET